MRTRRTDLPLADIGELAERLRSYRSPWRALRNPDGSWCVHGPNGICIAKVGDDAFAERRARFIAALDPSVVSRLIAEARANARE